jgi:hypothetical protein
MEINSKNRKKHFFYDLGNLFQLLDFFSKIRDLLYGKNLQFF